jgi:hypothetical protein
MHVYHLDKNNSFIDKLFNLCVYHLKYEILILVETVSTGFHRHLLSTSNVIYMYVCSSLIFISHSIHWHHLMYIGKKMLFVLLTFNITQDVNGSIYKVIHLFN